MIYIIDAHNLRRLGRLNEIKPNYVPPVNLDIVTDAMGGMNLNNAQATDENGNLDRNQEHQRQQDSNGNFCAQANPKNPTASLTNTDKEERAFKCGFCKERLRSARGLTRHEREKHGDEQEVQKKFPFQCTDCKTARFTRKAELNRHQRDYH